MTPTSDDPPTGPRPELTGFFTWSAADAPHPYPPPATDLAASGAARDQSVSSQKSDLGASVDQTIAITPIRRPPRMQRPLVILWSIFAVVATIAVVLWRVRPMILERERHTEWVGPELEREAQIRGGKA